MKTFESNTSLQAYQPMARPTTLSSSLAVSPSIHAAQFLTNTPIPLVKKTRWYQGWAALLVIVTLNAIGCFINRGPALAILSMPVMLFLNEGFQQTHPDQDATRRCAIEGFAKGAILGPPVLALAEMVGGVVLALVCFGQTAFENIVNSASQVASDQLPSSFSTRLFREATTQDPVGAAVFALLSSLLVAGLSEEAFKMGIGAWQVSRYRSHKRTLNPIIVMLGVGLGLAYAESMVAISGLRGTSAARLASERVLTSFPIHVACAVWSAKRASRVDSWIGALLPSALVHGLFDFGIILCSNYLTRVASLGWSFTAAAATTMAGMKST
jgi:hypothetical protein